MFLYISQSLQEEDQLGQLIDDPELLRQLVADLPGMDQGSPEIQNVLQKGAASNRDEVFVLTFYIFS